MPDQALPLDVLWSQGGKLSNSLNDRIPNHQVQDGLEFCFVWILFAVSIVRAFGNDTYRMAVERL